MVNIDIGQDVAKIGKENRQLLVLWPNSIPYSKNCRNASLRFSYEHQPLWFFDVQTQSVHLQNSEGASRVTFFPKYSPQAKLVAWPFQF